MTADEAQPLTGKRGDISKECVTCAFVWEKRDVHAGNEWDSSGLWANARGRPDVFTGLLYYLECIYVSMMHGRID